MTESSQEIRLREAAAAALDWAHSQDEERLPEWVDQLNRAMHKGGDAMSSEWEYCVVTGTVGDGFEITGPFGSEDEASEWASELADAWVVLPVHSPAEGRE
jgi:hypothetical protein